MTPEGQLSLEPHPTSLGSALTHGQITMDYSESQLELVTPVAYHPWESLEQLDRLHRFTLSCMGNELMWPASMPCVLPEEEEIPIAHFGTSKEGMRRTLYRRGLGHRYGKTMQLISGIHYNFSMPETFWQHAKELWPELPSGERQSDHAYFGLMRNVQRHAWLLTYLFGASPMTDRSFSVAGAKLLLVLDDQTLGLPWATSLRMSDIGYANHQVSPSLTGLAEYLNDVSTALNTPHPDFQQFETQEGKNPQQLNANCIQSESELYSDVRPKSRLAEGETLMQALAARGVEYVELRALDLNPFLPHGLDEAQIRFLDAFMLYCLLADSPSLAGKEADEARHNKRRVALEGREPGLKLMRNGHQIRLTQLANELLKDIELVAELLDSAQCSGMGPGWQGQVWSHKEAVQSQRRKVEDSRLTPSARMLEAREACGSFREFALEQAWRHNEYYRSLRLSQTDTALMRHHATRSLHQQKLLEWEDSQDVESATE